MNVRYIEEDIPSLLVPWYYIAKYINSESIAIETLINSANLLLGKNYFENNSVIEDAIINNLSDFKH
jgi:hypothetical protein